MQVKTNHNRARVRAAALALLLLAPVALVGADPGDFTGQVVRVPYTAEYFFYRAR